MHRHAQIRWKLTFAIIALLVATAGLHFANRFLHQPPSGVPSSEEVANKDNGSTPKPASRLVNNGHSGRFSRSKLPPFGGGVHNDPNNGPKVGSEPTYAESTVEAHEIIARLTRINLSSGALTWEQANDLRESFTQLARQGRAAIPAVREFLERNLDLDFAELNAAKAVGYSSLRIGLLDVLRQVGGPDAVAAFRGVLQTTADPLEIALVARNLEEAAPGQYRQDALNAARDTLAMVAEGNLSIRDVAPIFQMLQNYADASVVADLEKAAANWDYYARIALAGLPDGQGIPALIQEAKETGGKGRFQNTLALELLAQVATQYPEASAALIEQAKENRLPDQVWPQIASALAGAQYQFVGQASDDGIARINFAPGLRMYQARSGNQHFYNTPLPADWSEDQLNQRRQLIDQLLAVNNTPAAVEALQRALSMLAAKTVEN